MRSVVIALCAVLSIGIAQGARHLARDPAAADLAEPYAPSPQTAPILSLGYREVAADLLFFRLVGYFGSGNYTSEGVIALVEAISTLDSHYKKIYEWGALAMMMSAHKTKDPRDVYLRTVALLEKGARIYPSDYRMPQLAGEVYMLELQTTDPQERRLWDEKGAQLLESAVRKPGAPASAAFSATHLRTKLGQHQRAIDNLRELLLITDDDRARAEILHKLEELQGTDSAVIANEVLELRQRFLGAWRRDRPYIPAALYILIGPPSKPGFDLTDLAAGGRDMIDTSAPEPLEPIGP
jgi:hypothetical protein